MNPQDKDITALLSAFKDQDAPEISLGEAEDMVAAAMDAFDAEEPGFDWLDAEPSAQPDPRKEPEALPAPANQGWSFGSVALAGVLALAVLSWSAMSQQQQPGELLVADASTTRVVHVLVFNAEAGLTVAVTENQPVLLRMGPHEVLLEGEGVVVVESIEDPTVQIKHGDLVAHWTSPEHTPLKLNTPHGAVELLHGEATLKVSQDAFDWNTKSGALRPFNPAPKNTSRPTPPHKRAAPKSIAPVKAALADLSAMEPMKVPTPTVPAPRPAKIVVPVAPAPAVVKSAPPPAPTAEALYERAERAMKTGDNVSAIEQLKHLRSAYPNTATSEIALFDLARLFSEMDESVGAPLFERYLRLYPNGVMAPEARRRLQHGDLGGTAE